MAEPEIFAIKTSKFSRKEALYLKATSIKDRAKVKVILSNIP